MWKNMTDHGWRWSTTNEKSERTCMKGNIMRPPQEESSCYRLGHSKSILSILFYIQILQGFALHLGSHILNLPMSWHAIRSSSPVHNDTYCVYLMQLSGLIVKRIWLSEGPTFMNLYPSWKPFETHITEQVSHICILSEKYELKRHA